MTNMAFVSRLEEAGLSLSHLSTQKDLSYFETLPPGFRFKPSDQELVEYYLKNKVEGRPLPPNKIINDDIYLGSPGCLLEKYKKIWSESECYFFTPRNRKYKKGHRPDRRALDGYWKATGSDKLIVCRNTVGYKRSLVYYKGNTHNGNKTDWLMHEYTLRSDPIRTGTGDKRLDDVVLCKIYKKVAKGEKEEKAECEAVQGGATSAPYTSDYDPNEEVYNPINSNNTGTNFPRPTVEHNNNYQQFQSYYPPQPEPNNASQLGNSMPGLLPPPIQVQAPQREFYNGGMMDEARNGFPMYARPISQYGVPSENHSNYLHHVVLPSVEANSYLNALFGFGSTGFSEDEFPYSEYNGPWKTLFDNPKPPTL